ncbi:MAG: VWA domain-containing protein [Planctomycetota bacterium]
MPAAARGIHARAGAEGGFCDPRPAVTMRLDPAPDPRPLRAHEEAPHEEARTVTHRHLALLAVMTLCAGAAPAQGDALGDAFTKWFRYFEKGRFPPEGRDWRKRSPILPPDMRLVPEGFQGSYDRVEESRDILTLLVQRGGYADGERLLQVLAQPRPTDPLGANVHDGVVELVAAELARPGLPVGLQAAVLDRLEAGQLALPGRDERLGHSEPELAMSLLPLLGDFHPSRFRPVLERYLGSGDFRLVLAAGEGLSRMRSARSLPVLVDALGRFSTPDRLRELVRLVLELDSLALDAADDDGEGAAEGAGEEGTGKPGAADGAAEAARARDKAAREALERHLLAKVREAWARQTEPRSRMALVPLFRTWRSADSVPFLLAELRRALDQQKAAGHATSLPFLVAAVHETLCDLCGAFHAGSDPEDWFAFWEQEKARFVLAPRPEQKGTTRAEGFFGIPVRGRCVLFVLDCSGSMSAGTLTGEAPESGVLPSRLERAKQELLAAVEGMDDHRRFNVVLFSTSARAWMPAPRPATERRRQALASSLRGLQPRGGTNLLAALRLGIAGRIKEQQGRYGTSIDEVFVLSDGMPSSPPDLILERVRQWNPGRAAAIHAVYLGQETRGLPIDQPERVGPDSFMRRLAEENGGRFVALR